MMKSSKKKKRWSNLPLLLSGSAWSWTATAATFRSRSASGSRSRFGSRGRTAFTAAAAATAAATASAASSTAFRDQFDRMSVQFCVIQIIQSIFQCPAVPKFNDTLSLSLFVRGGGGGGDRGDRRGNPPGRKTEYRCIVENISSKTSWQVRRRFFKKKFLIFNHIFSFGLSVFKKQLVMFNPSQSFGKWCFLRLRWQSLAFKNMFDMDQIKSR